MLQKLSFRLKTIRNLSLVTHRRKMSSFTNIAQQIKLDILSKTHVDDNIAKRKEISRTFISDTITVPTKEMYEYAALATVGDDVYFEPSTKALETHMAQITGKEAALFVPSGTASNQIALRTHLLQPPYTVLCDHRAHIHKYEAGGAAFHSGAAVTAVIPSNGHHLTLEDISENMILGSDTHMAPTEVVALENTLNGTIFPQEEIITISEFVHSHGKKMHLDGARLWHVAAETETPLKELCDPFDSVSLCFSKGLGAPIGSCLVGTQAFITKARWIRKLFGGGMRQTGILAASAAYALSYNFPLLPAVHELSRKLEAGLEEIGVEITSRAETCMIFYDPSSVGVTYDEIADRASDLPEPLILGGSRLVLHIQTSESAVQDFLSVVGKLAKEKKAAGFAKPEPPANGKSVYKDIYVRRASKKIA
ncbi:pyridoxal phosphate-dependent transferase [Mycena maculata]|uniref:Pyridoxal phosphate-dependent transferase n=1 Tax=Mycena maculata TaxID=230809 RepID=A0AAD7KDM8_9AGAR|nr:pyridoxal phosphate-dependent transferase [Mycena maculata]